MSTPFDGSWNGGTATIDSQSELVTIQMPGSGRPSANGSAVTVGAPVIYADFTDDAPFTGVLSADGQKILWSNATVWTRDTGNGNGDESAVERFGGIADAAGQNAAAVQAAIKAASSQANGVNFGPFSALVVPTSLFSPIWQSRRGNTPITFFQYQGGAPAGWLPLGDIAAIGGAPLVPGVMLFAQGTDPQAFANPVSFVPVMSDAGSRNPQDVVYWRPVPPTGYLAVGICFSNGDMPATSNYWCVSEAHVQQVSANTAWGDSGQGWDGNGDLLAAAFTNSAPEVAPDETILILPLTYLSADDTDNGNELPYALVGTQATLDDGNGSGGTADAAAPNAAAVQAVQAAITAANPQANGVDFGAFSALVVPTAGNFTDIADVPNGDTYAGFYQFQGTGPGGGWLPLGDIVAVGSTPLAPGVMFFKPNNDPTKPGSVPTAFVHPTSSVEIVIGIPNIAYWTLVAPTGYVSLGLCFTNGPAPDLSNYWCVSESYVMQVGTTLSWSDAGTGWPQDGTLLAPAFTASAPEIAPPGGILILPPTVGSSPNNFVGYALVGTQATLDVAPIARPAPVYVDGMTAPGSTTATGLGNVVVVPFTAVPGDAIPNQALRSPFYYVASEPSWVCTQVLPTPLGGTLAYTETIGVSQTDSTRFQQTTSMTVSCEFGAAYGGASASVSASLTEETPAGDLAEHHGRHRNHRRRDAQPSGSGDHVDLGRAEHHPGLPRGREHGDLGDVLHGRRALRALGDDARADGAPGGAGPRVR